MGMYIKNEESLKEKIVDIINNLSIDYLGPAVTDESIDRAANSIILLISAELRNQKLNIARK